MERWSGALRLAHRSDSSPDIADAGEELKQQCSKNSVETPGMTTAVGPGAWGLLDHGPIALMNRGLGPNGTGILI